MKSLVDIRMQLFVLMFEAVLSRRTRAAQILLAAWIAIEETMTSEELAEEQRNAVSWVSELITELKA